MDLTRLNACLAVGCSGEHAHGGKGRGVNFNRLTLVTLVIAIAGFAGTAFAGDPPCAGAQASATASR